jgi:hypothetical protein
LIQIPSPEELEMQAALAEKDALLTKVWTMMPPQMAYYEARLWQMKLSMSAARVKKAYIAVTYGRSAPCQMKHQTKITGLKLQCVR